MSSSQYHSSPIPPASSPGRPARPTFILDFDGTITTRDTISPLFNAALNFHIQHGRGEEMRAALKEILGGYVRDLEAYERGHEHLHVHRRRREGDWEGEEGGEEGGEGDEDEEGKGKIEGERDGYGTGKGDGEGKSTEGERREEKSRTLQEVVAYQRGLRGVESRSFERVSTSGILGGLDEEIWAQAARKAVDEGALGREGVNVRKGFQSFLRKLRESQGSWRVLSVNFCESWIRGILSTQGVDDGVSILANQPDGLGRLHGPEGGDGNRGDVLVTCDGKLAAMQESLEGVAEGGSGARVVYIGDSLTDIECLLQEGVVGVVMVGEDGTSKLLDTLRCVGSNGGCGYLKDIRDIKEFSGGQGKALYFARDFGDIRDSPLFD